tara:strand:+ start:584 stop:751 length:168 start_codon:yes stop_codon:yes gene_type:complete
MNICHSDCQLELPPVDKGTGSVLVIGVTVISLAALVMASIATTLGPTVEYLLAWI